MKKNILLTFVLLMVGGLSTLAAAAPDGDTGNEDYWSDHAANTFASQDESAKTLSISTPEELALLANKVNSGTSYAGYTITISGTLDMGAHYWIPINAREGQLSGSKIQGSNTAVISNLKIDKAVYTGNYDYYAGFIAQSVGALTVKDLTFSGAVSVANGSGVATVLGLTYGNVLFDNVKVANSTVTASTKAGALVGFTGGDGVTVTVKNCSFENVTVKAEYSYALMVGLVNTNDNVVFEGNNTATDSRAEIDETAVTNDFPTRKTIKGYTYGVDDNKLWVIGVQDAWAECRTNPTPKKMIDGVEYSVMGDIFYHANNVIVDVCTVAKIGETTYASLAEAVAAVPTDGTETTITMIGDDSYTGTNPIEIASEKTIILDLNGKTISYVSNNTASDAFITNKGKLTIIDKTEEGKITAQQKTDWNYGSYTINNYSGNLVINGGTIENTSDAGLAWPLNNGVWGSTADMVINGGTIHSTNYVPVREYLQYGGTKTITINGGTFVSDNSRAIAVQFNDASVAETNSYVKVNGGTFNCNGSGIFYFDLHAANLNTTGFTFEITAGSFTNINTENPVVAIDNEGKEQSSAVLPQKFISGGTFSKAPDAKYVAEGYEVVEQDNAFIVQKKQVAKIGETTYASLAEAIAAVKDGETITMIQDVKKAAGISVPSGKNFTVDFGGHKYAMECPGAGSAATKTSGFQLLKNSNIVFKNGTIECTEANKDKTWTSTSESKGIAMIIQNYANLTLDGMTIDATNIAHNGAAVRYALSNNSGNVEYKGNTTITTVGNDYAFDVCKYDTYDAPTVKWNSTGTVNGGIELSGGNFVVAQNLAVSVPVMAAEGESTLEIGKGATLSSSANFNDPNPNLGNGHTTGPVQVKQGAGLTIGGAGTIEGINNAYSAVIVSISGDDDSKTAKLTVNGNVTLQGEYYGIVGNGQRHNTEIVVNGGTIKGVHSQDNVGIFHPQAGKLTINGGAIEGYSSAVEIRGGSITVTGGSLTSTATVFKCNPNGSGNTTEGAALAIAQHNTKKDISVLISGGEFTGVKALNECNPQENVPAPQVTMNVSGGKFKGEVFTVDVKNFLAGGIYSQQPGDSEYLVIGKTVIDNPDEATKGEYPFAVVPRADEVQVAPNLEIAPAEGEQPLTDDEKTKAKEAVSDAITDMRRNESAILPEETKQSNTEAVDESVLTTNQSVGINVEFDGVKVKVETESVSLKELTFDVTPYVVEKVQVGEEEKSVSVKKIENKDIKAPMTFRLPIPSDVTDNCARIIHHKENGEDENMGLYSITKNEEEKYIEISTPSFSKFDIVLENVVAPDKLNYYAGSSGLIETTDPNAFLNAKATNPNAIAIVSSEYAEFAAVNTNVLVESDNDANGKSYVCPKFVLTDLEDFYSPYDFVATTGSYTRIADNVKGMNSVCLPFTIKKENVNNGKIGTYKSSEITNGTGTISFNDGESIAAGVPCIVECTGGVAWEITFNNTEIKATIDDSNPIKGAYIKKDLGAGFFKVSSDGTKFVNTVDGTSHAWPFRAYLDLTTQSDAKELTIEWNDGSTTGINTIDNGQLTIDNSKAYNLNGMRVNDNYKGIVIMNGKKYIK